MERSVYTSHHSSNGNMNSNVTVVRYQNRKINTGRTHRPYSEVSNVTDTCLGVWVCTKFYGFITTTKINCRTISSPQRSHTLYFDSHLPQPCPQPLVTTKSVFYFHLCNVIISRMLYMGIIA